MVHAETAAAPPTTAAPPVSPSDAAPGLGATATASPPELVPAEGLKAAAVDVDAIQPPALSLPASVAAADSVNPPPPVSARSGASGASSIIDLCNSDSESESEEEQRQSSSRASSSRASSSRASSSRASSSRASSARKSGGGAVKSGNSSIIISSSTATSKRSSSNGSKSGNAALKVGDLAAIKEAKERLGVDEASYGRGKRQIKPITVKVGSNYVKLSNAYEVKGSRYVYDKGAQALAVAGRPAYEPHPPKPKPKPKPTPQQLAAKPKESLTAHERVQAELAQRNAAVQAMKAKAAGRRAQFLRRHLEVIRPFVSPYVAARLEAGPAPPLAAPARAAQQQPEVVMGGEMRDYQLLGLQFMLERHDAGVPIILGDEMGLGKTLQSLALLAHLHLERGLTAPSLVVCPLSVLSSWMNEARRWVPGLKMLQMHTGTVEERKRMVREDLLKGSYHVCVTTYEMVKNETCRHYLVGRIHWSYLVLDEGHVIKNEATGLAQTLRRMHLGNVLLLTGTPLQNNLRELWALLNFLLPDVFDEAAEEIFSKCFNIGAEKRVDTAMLGMAHALLKPFMLRRLKVDVERGLPPRVETKVVCHVSEMQGFWYKRLLLKDADIMARVGEQEHGGAGGAGADGGEGAAAAAGAAGAGAVVSPRKKLSGTDWKRLQALIIQLRKACNHPYLFWGAETSEETDLQEMIEASGKLHTLDRLLPKLKAAGHRVVIFSQWTHLLDILDDYLFLRGYRYTRLDGGTNRIRRQINIEAFNAPESPLFAFLMTTRAGGLGVNLQTADTVILFDSDWNPQADAQAMARVHRIGQTKVVHVYRLITKGTVEERMIAKAEKKQFLSEHVNRDSLVEANARAGGASKALQQQGASDDDDADAGGEEGGLSKSDTKELLSNLTFGADAVAAAAHDNEPLDDATLEAIIDRTRTGNECLATLKADKKTVATFDAEKEEVSTRVLQGQTYEKPKIVGLGDISKEWAALVEGKKRKRQNRVTMVEMKGSGYGAPVPVLRENEYDLEAGEASVFQRELKGRADQQDFKVLKRTKLTAGRDFSHDDWCQACADGGDLVCCDYCPSVWHEHCLAAKPKAQQWRCPQHNCFECGRSGAAAGGVIFRCVACAYACCYDHKPEDSQILGANARHEALGFPPSQHVAYIHCSAECQQFAATVIKAYPPPEAARYPMES